MPATPLGIAIAIIGALLTLVWGQLRTQNGEQGRRILHLEGQNTDQQKELTRLTTQMKAREDAHADHRENTMSAIQQLRSDTYERLRSIDAKLDRLLGGPRKETPPTPGRYGG